jgi:hypothetical protein
MNISVEFKKLIAFEINKATNLHDLIYMTDRGQLSYETLDCF